MVAVVVSFIVVPEDTLTKPRNQHHHNTVHMRPTTHTAIKSGPYAVGAHTAKAASSLIVRVQGLGFS